MAYRIIRGRDFDGCMPHVPSLEAVLNQTYWVYGDRHSFPVFRGTKNECEQFVCENECDDSDVSPAGPID